MKINSRFETWNRSCETVEQKDKEVEIEGKEELEVQYPKWDF